MFNILNESFLVQFFASVRDSLRKRIFVRSIVTIPLSFITFLMYAVGRDKKVVGDSRTEFKDSVQRTVLIIR